MRTPMAGWVSDGSFGIGEAAILEQNVVRDADLADIAEQGADANAFDFIFEEAAFVG